MQRGGISWWRWPLLPPDAAKEREGSVARWRQLVRRGSKSGGGTAMTTTTTATALRWGRSPCIHLLLMLFHLHVESVVKNWCGFACVDVFAQDVDLTLDLYAVKNLFFSFFFDTKSFSQVILLGVCLWKLIFAGRPMTACENRWFSHSFSCGRRVYPPAKCLFSSSACYRLLKQTSCSFNRIGSAIEEEI